MDKPIEKEEKACPTLFSPFEGQDITFSLVKEKDITLA